MGESRFTRETALPARYTIRVGWGTSTFSAHVHIEDPSVVPDSSDQLWNGDTVQLYVASYGDLKGSYGIPSAESANEQVTHIIVSPPSAGYPSGRAVLEASDKHVRTRARGHLRLALGIGRLRGRGRAAVGRGGRGRSGSRATTSASTSRSRTKTRPTDRYSTVCTRTRYPSPRPAITLVRRSRVLLAGARVVNVARPHREGSRHAYSQVNMRCPSVWLHVHPASVMQLQSVHAVGLHA